MNIYLAARYARGPELIPLAEELARLGHRVTSRWITGHGGELAAPFTTVELNTDPARCANYALIDLEDLAAADLVVSLTDAPGGKGGRHVEFGYALAAGKCLALIGPREHVFHAHPAVRQYSSWDAFVVALTTGCGTDDPATDDGDDTIGDGIVFPPGDLDHPPLDGLDTPDRPG